MYVSNSEQQPQEYTSKNLHSEAIHWGYFHTSLRKAPGFQKNMEKVQFFQNQIIEAISVSEKCATVWPFLGVSDNQRC